MPWGREAAEAAKAAGQLRGRAFSTLPGKPTGPRSIAPGSAVDGHDLKVGWYWCGYRLRKGLGWGGPEGYQGWKHR
jgi:hypothetical protein